MRAAVGTEVTLFDGSGAEFVAQVTSVGRAAVELVIVSRAEVDRELPIAVTLGVALPKGERQRFLIEKSVELGVGRFVPLITQRSAVRFAAPPRGRLERIVVEASKQCGRNRLMTIAPPQAWSDFVGRQGAAEPPRQVVRWVAHPAATGRPLWAVQTPVSPQQIFLAVGPEGGLTDSEVRLAEQAGWSVVGLGPRLLRIETAALVMASLAAARGL